MLATTAIAQQPPEQPPTVAEDAPPPKTTPPDYQYGEQTVEEVGKLPGFRYEEPPVDRRQELDPFAAQGNLFPTAHVSEDFSASYRNHLFYGHSISVTPHERISVSGMVVLSPADVGFEAGADHDFFAAGFVRGVLYRSRNVTVSLQPGILRRAGRQALDTRETSGQLALVADVFPDDRIALSVGVLGGLPLAYSYQREDTSACADREEYFAGDCVDTENVTEDAQGGSFVLGYVGASYFAPNNLVFKAEVFTGAHDGTIYGVEGALYNTNSLPAQRAQYEDGSWRFGPTEGAPVGGTLGVGWSSGGFGVHVALIGLLNTRSFEDQRSDTSLPSVFPMSTIGYTY